MAKPVAMNEAAARIARVLMKLIENCLLDDPQFSENCLSTEFNHLAAPYGCLCIEIPE
jgi:hypothetical protein